ncbi:MAG: amidohydrolase [Oscillospiraceae bacterium]|nr:amidohydrolase [Oscillospiraceae bacterium]
MNTIYYNGNIYVERDRFVQAMLVSDGLVQKIGTLEEVTEGLCPKCEKEMIDLEGRTVIPGFNDSHCHILGVGQALACVILHGSTSMAEILEKGRQFLAAHPLQAGDVLIGRGWNQDYFTDEARIPTRYDLDKITTEYPVIYTRTCGHMLVANSKALEVAGITRDTQPLPGGVIYKDENGEPNGQISENAQAQIQCIVPRTTPESVAANVSLAMEYAASLGITTVQTCDLSGEGWEVVDNGYKLMYETNPNAIRSYQQSTFYETESYKAFLDAGCSTGNGNDMYKYGPLKMFVDGSLGARTAYLRNPYADDASTRGVSTMTVEHFDDMVQLADSNNCQVAVHCIGDAAIEMVLNAYDKVVDGRNNKNRHAIIHCQITDKPLVEKFTEHDILAQVQPIFIHYDMNIVAERCGEELASTSYAFGDMYRMGIHTSFGTDSPVENLQPYENLYCAVTRKRLDGERTYRPDQCVDIYDAIDQYTISSAYTEFAENRKGRLMPGFLADFAVLDRNIFEIPSDEIKDVQCVRTVLGGRTIFAR